MWQMSYPFANGGSLGSYLMQKNIIFEPTEKITTNCIKNLALRLNSIIWFSSFSVLRSNIRYRGFYMVLWIRSSDPAQLEQVLQG